MMIQYQEGKAQRKGDRTLKIQAQRERAGIFSQMHKKKGMFVIPNAWDAASAYIFEREGFEAVATTSARNSLFSRILRRPGDNYRRS